jgi:hypothetical protein
MNTNTTERPEVAKDTATAVALRQVNANVAEFDHIEAGLLDLERKYRDVAYDCTTTLGMVEAKAARQEIRTPRYAAQNAAEAAKKPLTALSKAIGARKDEICARILAVETPIDAQIKAEEDRKAVEKAAREQKEREAAAAIQARIDHIRAFSIIPAGVKAAGIKAGIDNLQAIDVTLDAYGDRAGEAAQAKAQTLERMNELLTAAVSHEAEQARMEAERAELARLRAEAEAAAKVERARIAAEQKAQAERLAAERAAFEAEQAAARAEAKKRDDADRARRDEEDRKAREARAAEDKRIADARAALEAEQRAVREAEEARAAAARKVEQDAADAAAAAERKRLDDEAAARRAEETAALEAMKQEALRADRIRNAAPAMLGALQVVSATPRIPKEVLGVVLDAIALATGETA